MNNFSIFFNTRNMTETMPLLAGGKSPSTHRWKSSKKTKIHPQQPPTTQKLTLEDIETIREYTTKTRVFDVGGVDIGEMPVKITPHDITFRGHTYQYEKLFILTWHDEWISEKQYMMPINKDKKSGYYKALYMLVKIDAKRYLSLSWVPFEFEIPDNDEIVDVSMIRTTRSGTQYITLFGRRNTYFIDDYNDDIDVNSYLSNEDIKKYLPQFINSSGDIDRDIHLWGLAGDDWQDGKGPYLIQEEKTYKKVLGIKVPIYKEKRIYDVIHYLDIKEISEK